MNTTTLLGTKVLDEQRHFNWGAAIAGAIAATAVGFFLLTLGSGVGLALMPHNVKSAGTFLTLGAIYFFAAQAFSFVVGGYLVGRLIGPEVETDKEEEFRAGAHGLVMWAVTIVAGLVLVGLSSVVAGSTLYAGMSTARAESTSGYWMDELFHTASNEPGIAADKAEAGRLIAANIARGGDANDDDSVMVGRMVSQDAGVSMTVAMARVADIQAQMRQEADTARKAASIASLWTAFALLFGAVVSVAAAISSRWMDDKVSFSLAPRR